MFLPPPSRSAFLRLASVQTPFPPRPSISGSISIPSSPSRPRWPCSPPIGTIYIERQPASPCLPPPSILDVTDRPPSYPRTPRYSILRLKFFSALWNTWSLDIILYLRPSDSPILSISLSESSISLILPSSASSILMAAFQSALAPSDRFLAL